MPVTLAKIIDGKPVISGDFTCSFELREGAAFAEVPPLRRPRAQNARRKKRPAPVGMIAGKSRFLTPPKCGGFGVTSAGAGAFFRGPLFVRTS